MPPNEQDVNNSIKPGSVNPQGPPKVHPSGSTIPPMPMESQVIDASQTNNAATANPAQQPPINELPSLDSLMLAQGFNNTKPRKNPMKGLLIVMIVILFVLVFATEFAEHLTHKSSGVVTQPKVNSASNSSQPNNDDKTEQDLAKLGYALENYSGSPSSCLPNNLAQLNIKNLNFSLSSYKYTLLDQCTGGPATYEYQICADFKTNTFTSASYNNIFDTADIDGSSPQIYSVHTAGEQCYTNELGDEGTGLQMVLSNGENNLLGNQSS